MNQAIPFTQQLRTLAMLCLFTGHLHAADPSKPNILLIFADDLGWKDVGYQGTDFYETPNIDRLATEGMVFTTGYAAAANCVPSRACLLSGQCTPRHGVYAVGSTKRGPGNLMRLEPIANTKQLAGENVTMAEALKSAGYTTGHFGKWHIGTEKSDDGTGPRDQGFDVSMDKNHKGSGASEDPKAIYTITKAACSFIEENKDRPFFAYVAHHAIHVDQQARQASLDRFSAKKPGQQHNNPLYAGCTYDLDNGVRILLAKLHDLGLDEKTLVVFTSDNGGTSASSQEPLRGNKGCYYEGGIREPFIMRWPGVVQPGTRCDVPVISLDLYPTFLAAANAPAPQSKVLDGESLLPLLSGKGVLTRSSLFWHFPGYLDEPVSRGRDPIFRSRPVSVIHRGDWKLHLYHEEWQLDGGREKLATNNAVELYHIKEDPGEHHNLASQNTTKREELLDELLAWQKEIKAPLPSQPNPKYADEKPASMNASPKPKRRKRTKQP
jgi:arylsulfatase A-like enzyme